MLLTEAGAAIGTVAYMSPEQARGERLDARSDLFSFGVLLYQMATGKLPFEGKTPAVVFAAILNEKPAPVRHLRPELSRKLEHIVQSALAKERDRRPQSAAELRSALQSAKRELESGVPLSGPLNLWRSRRLPLLSTALMAILLIGRVYSAALDWAADPVPRFDRLRFCPFRMRREMLRRNILPRV